MLQITRVTNFLARETIYGTYSSGLIINLRAPRVCVWRKLSLP